MLTSLTNTAVWLVVIVGLIDEKPMLLLGAAIIGVLLRALPLRLFAIGTGYVAICLGPAMILQRGDLQATANVVTVGVLASAFLAGLALRAPRNLFFLVVVSSVAAYALGPALNEASLLGVVRTAQDFQFDVRNYWGAIFTLLVMADGYGRARLIAGVSYVGVGIASLNKFSLMAAPLLWADSRRDRMAMAIIVVTIASILTLALAENHFEQVVTSVRNRLNLYREFFGSASVQPGFLLMGGQVSVLSVNSEQVRSWHSMLLDLIWYEGLFGLVAFGLVIRTMWLAVRHSVFSITAFSIWLLSVLFGLPPIGNERHSFLFVGYALSGLWRKSRGMCDFR